MPRKQKLQERVQGMPPRKQSGFNGVDELLEYGRSLLLARQKLQEWGDVLVIEDEEHADVSRREEAWTKAFHRRFRNTSADNVIVAAAREHRLDQIDIELLTALILHGVCVISQRVSDCSDIVELVRRNESMSVKLLRALRPDSRLANSGLVIYEEEERDVRELRPTIDPDLIDAVLCDRQRNVRQWPTAETEEDLLRELKTLSKLLEARSEVLDSSSIFSVFSSSKPVRENRTIARMLRGLREALAAHADWRLAQVVTPDDLAGRPQRSLLLLALIGKELGHCPADDELYTGAGLARAISRSVEDVEKNLCLLSTEGSVIRDNCVQPCGGAGIYASDDPATLAKTEFELTRKTRELLELKRSVSKRAGGFDIRHPHMRLDQLVLAPGVRQALDMAMAQARHGRQFLDEWGLGEVITYGRAVTLLFAGPPGVGKTACAEGLAHALDMPIMVADFSEIQNCYVGKTEKNIVRAFREAARNGAVLFWDEADAMFFDRDDAEQSWEVRHVNVLLQELEKFEGVCVLATNRNVALDKAVARRITLKVNFDRPDHTARRAIWQKMLPPKLPLADDVDLDAIAIHDLTGGEIKNIILNAARLAMLADPPANVLGRAELERAIELEQTGRPSGDTRRIGFCASSSGDTTVKP